MLRTRIGSPRTSSSGLGTPSPTEAIRLLRPAASSIASTDIGHRPRFVDHMLANVGDRFLQSRSKVDSWRPPERSGQRDVCKRLFRLASQIWLVPRLEVGSDLSRDVVKYLADRV